MQMRLIYGLFQIRLGMFNGFRKIVGAIGSTENLDDSHEGEVQSTPCINKSKKRKALEAGAFSSKKK